MGQERCLVRPGPAGIGGAPADSQRPSRALFVYPKGKPMTTTFTASNGDTIETRHDGYLVVKDGHYTEWLSPCTVDTLREYFTAERDARDPHDN